ncbi:MAG: T9SS type A sorting domain-containing protein, partial [Bacteroidales bacterium]
VSASIADLIFCLYDIHGRKMLSEKITETTRLDVSGLPAGIYIYTLEYPGGRQTGRLVKIH